MEDVGKISNAGNKENNDVGESDKKKTGGAQVMMIKDPYHNKGKAPQKGQGSSCTTKNEYHSIKKGVFSLSTKMDKLDEKMNRILELLLNQNRATDDGQNVPKKSSDIAILKTPESNRKKPAPIEYPQLTSTPCHKIAFPATPIQQHLTPIAIVGGRNTLNSCEGGGGLESHQKTPTYPTTTTEIKELPATSAKKTNTLFKEPKQPKPETKQNSINEDIKCNYNPPLFLINSRSRARKQKQSAALRGASQVVPGTLTQTEVTVCPPSQMNVPTNEPVVIDTTPIAPNCDPTKLPPPPVGRHDYSISDTMDSNPTAEFLNVIVSTKSDVPPPTIVLDKSETSMANVKEQPKSAESSLLPTINDQAEMLNNFLPLPTPKTSEEEEDLKQESGGEDVERKKDVKKLEVKSQPVKQYKKPALTKKKKTLPSAKLADLSMETSQQEDRMVEISRPKRKAAPTIMKEPKLNTKMRREF